MQAGILSFHSGTPQFSSSLSWRNHLQCVSRLYLILPRCVLADLLFCTTKRTGRKSAACLSASRTGKKNNPEGRQCTLCSYLFTAVKEKSGLFFWVYRLFCKISHQNDYRTLNLVAPNSNCKPDVSIENSPFIFFLLTHCEGIWVVRICNILRCYSQSGCITFPPSLSEYSWIIISYLLSLVM